MLCLLVIGYSIVTGLTLLAAYLRSPNFPKKSAVSIGAATVLTLALVVIQWHHLRFLQGLSVPLDTWPYLLAIFIAPSMFFFFGWSIVRPDATPRPVLLLALLPVLLPVILPLTIALPLLLLAGAGYAIWLGQVVYRLRALRKQHHFELLFSVAMSVFAAAILTLGAALPWLDAWYFYVSYALCIGAAYLLVTFALVGIPDFVAELFEQGQAKYAVSSLAEAEVAGALGRLQHLMQHDQLFRDDALNLGSLAEALDLTSHQTSELINAHIGCSFATYLRQHRINAAREMLVQSPDQSVLTVGMETGFSSQSTFYAAFKRETGVSPGAYRRMHTK